jgi:hypothetical protein
LDKWTVEFHDDFVPEFKEFSEAVQNAIAAGARLIEKSGPMLGRPYCDTLKGSQFVNMKDLRISADGGEWRVAFAFNPRRKAALLVAGDKQGVPGKRFHARLIAAADRRFASHLKSLIAGKDR